MRKKNKRKNNKSHLRPPLTFLDKSIYVSGLVLSFLFVIILVICFDIILDRIAFGRPDTVAYRSSTSPLFALPFLLFLEISLFIFFISGLESKKPIFGSKKIPYGVPPYREDCVPLFSRKKYRVRKTPSQKRFERNMITLWCAVFLLLAAPVPLGLFSRDALCADNRVENINLFNGVSGTYTEDDYAHLTVQTEYVVANHSRYWKYEISIEMTDGKVFSFSNRDFYRWDSDTKDVCLDKMLEIRRLFDPEEITVKGTEDIGEVSAYYSFTEQQQEKLAELFSR